MSSLADLPQLVGFFSYSREDDEGSGGNLSKLRERIQEELRAQLGRTRRDFRLWQDKAAIAHGKLWESEIKTAISESAFFIPIVTPTAVRSHHCNLEFESFLAREKELGRNDLVFPIHYILVAALQDEARWRQDRVLNIVGSRQYIDWLSLRHHDVGSTEVRVAVERFCANIAKALQQPWLSPEQRDAKGEADAQRQAEQERSRREAEAERQAEEDRRRTAEAGVHRRTEEAARRRPVETTPTIAGEPSRAHGRRQEPLPLLSGTPADTATEPGSSAPVPPVVGLVLGIQGIVRVILAVSFVVSVGRAGKESTAALLLYLLLFLSPAVASMAVASGILRRQQWTTTAIGLLACLLYTAYDVVWLIIWAALAGGTLNNEAFTFIVLPTLAYIIVDAVSLYYLVRAYRRTRQA